jgi:hypothetical protein
MVASHTKKEYAKQARQVIELTAKFLGEWTEHQVQSIAVSERTPYIWPLGKSGYAIGTRRIMADDGYWKLIDAYNKKLHVFDNKLSAVFYCLSEQKGLVKMSESIKTADAEVLKLKNDVVHYEASVERAIKSKKSDSINIWTARLDDARLRLKSANNQLQKSLTSAKYIKYWE